MASDQTLRMIITALDRTAEPFHQINARVAAMSAPVREIGSRLGELAEETGLKGIGEHAKEALEHVHHLGEGLLEMAGPLAALTAAGSAAGLIEIAKSTAEFAEKLDIGAAKTGMATETLSGWHYAAGLVNVDVDQLDKGFSYLNRSINEAASGKAKDVETILTRMGLHNTPGHLVSTADALRATAAEAQHLVDSGQIQAATDMMGKLFGERRGAELLPLFEKGPEELNKVLAEAQEAGISLTAAQTAAGHGFMDQYKGMAASVEGLKIAIGDELFPVLTPAIAAIREFLNEHRQEIAHDIGDAIRYLSNQLKGVSWDDIKADIKDIAGRAEWLVDKVGGIGPALAIVGAISFAPTIAALGELGAAVAVNIAKFALFPVASLATSFVSLIPTIGSLSDVFAAFDLAISANPIGAVVLGVAALSVAGYELYEHWSEVSAYFQGLWNGMPDWAKTGIEAIGSALAPFVSIPLEVINHWSTIKTFFLDLWKGVPDGFKQGIEMVATGVYRLFTLPEQIIDHWSQIGTFFPAMWAKVTATFDGAWERIRPIAAGLEKALSWLGGGAAAAGTDGGPSGPNVAPGTSTGLERLTTQPPLSSLPGAAAAAGGASSQRGETKVTVDFKNLPPGATVSTESRGSAPPPDLNIGAAMAF